MDDGQVCQYHVKRDKVGHHGDGHCHQNEYLDKSFCGGFQTRKAVRSHRGDQQPSQHDPASHIDGISEHTKHVEAFPGLQIIVPLRDFLETSSGPGWLWSNLFFNPAVKAKTNGKIKATLTTIRMTRKIATITRPPGERHSTSDMIPRVLLLMTFSLLSRRIKPCVLHHSCE